MTSPYVFLIDLDQTIQGNISPQIREYILCKSINIKPSVKFYQGDFENGLLRPYFKLFIKYIKMNYKNKIELFVYTASEKKWANYIIPIIETLIDFKFNRPILNRTHCNMNEKEHKSISYVDKHVLRTLKKKYQYVNNINDLKNRIFLIDNNYVLKESPYLIKCPSYDHTVFVNTLRNIPENIQKQKYKEIGESLFNLKPKSYFHMLKIVYDQSFKQYIMYEENNSMYKNDKFWKVVVKIMKHYGLDVISIIKYLQQLDNGKKTK